MFSNKKPENNSKSAASNQTNQFVEGTVIQGEIRSSNDIRVDGKVIGSLSTNAKLVIGGNGLVEGEITCKNADISGTIKGSVEVGELLFLKKTAVIEGDIVTKKLVVEEGAKFNGTCNMGVSSQQLKNEENVTTAFKKEAV